MFQLPPAPESRLAGAVVNAALRRAKTLWKRAGLGVRPYGATQAKYVLDTFFTESHSGLELLDFVVESTDEPFSAIQMRVRYTDDEDGTGMTRWFVWRRADEDPGAWAFQEDEGW